MNILFPGWYRWWFHPSFVAHQFFDIGGQAVAGGRCWRHAAWACRFHGQSHQANVGSTGEVADHVWDTWHGKMGRYYWYCCMVVSQKISNIWSIPIICPMILTVVNQHIHPKPYLTIHQLLYLEGCPVMSGPFFSYRCLTLVRQHGIRMAAHPLVLGVADALLAPYCERIQLHIGMFRRLCPGETPHVGFRKTGEWGFPMGFHSHGGSPKIKMVGL